MHDSPDELQADPENSGGKGETEVFHVMWFETRLGVRYEMPDMLESHITKTHHHLDTIPYDSQLVVLNISGATLILPKRIIKRAGVGERCFWEALE